MKIRKMFTDEELTSFLDGEADAELAREIEIASVRNRQLRKRIDSLTIDKSELASAFAGLLKAAPNPPAVLTKSEAPRPHMTGQWPAIAASGLICLALGWGAATYVAMPQVETWQQFAATYHALYVKDTLANISVDANSTELSRISASIGKSIELPTLARFQQLEFKRAQLLGFEGRQLVQIAFLSKTGAPVALCIMRAGRPHDSPVNISKMRGMSSATWTKGEYEYLLVGGTDQALIEAGAEAFSKVL